MFVKNFPLLEDGNMFKFVFAAIAVAFIAKIVDIAWNKIRGKYGSENRAQN